MKPFLEMGEEGREKGVLFPQAPCSSPPVTYVPALSLPHNVKADKDGKDVYFHSWLSLIRIQSCLLVSESPSVKWVVALPDEVSEEVHDQSNAQLMEVCYVLIDYVRTSLYLQGSGESKLGGGVG